MKTTFLITLCFFGISICGKSQVLSNPSDTIQVILDNNIMKVTEYVSSPGKDVCGKGKHSHAPHLTVFLTDAKVRQTTADGKSENFELKSGATFWSEADTHIAINNGSKTAKVYLVEVK